MQGLFLMMLGQNRAFVPLYFEEVEIWSMATDLSQTHSQTLEDRATQGRREVGKWEVGVELL